jgi:hypothetical protein
MPLLATHHGGLVRKMLSLFVRRVVSPPGNQQEWLGEIWMLWHAQPCVQLSSYIQLTGEILFWDVASCRDAPSIMENTSFEVGVAKMNPASSEGEMHSG